MRLNRIFYCLLCISILMGCARGKQQIDLPLVSEIDSRFSAHISGFSGGLLGKNDPVVVELVQPAEGVEIGEEVPNNELFTFEPKLEGKIKWVSPYMVSFIPEKPLDPNVIYHGHFNLGQLKSIEEEDLRIFSFYFKAKDQIYKMVYSHFENQSNNRVILHGSVSSNDVIDSTQLFSNVRLLVGGKATEIIWTRKSGAHYDFQSVAVARTAQNQSFELIGDAKFFGTKVVDKGQIPAIGDFSIVQLRASTQESQHLLVVFSELLDPLQDLKGRIKIGDQDNLSFVIEGNRLKVFPRRNISGPQQVFISEAISSDAGFRLNETKLVEVVFTDAPPAIELLGSGAIVPTTDGAHFPFKAINLSAVDVFVTKINSNNIIQFLQENKLDGDQGLKRVGKEVWRQTLLLDKNKNLQEWNNYAVNISRFIEEDPTALYRVTLAFKKEYAIYDCGNTITNDFEPIRQVEPSWSEADWEVRSWYRYDYDYDWEYDGVDDWNNPCGNRFYRNKRVSKNVTVSDIGMIAKAGEDKTMHIFVSNLKTANPISGAKVKFYSFRQELLGEKITDEGGYLNLRLEEKPFVAVAEFGGQKTYLRLRDNDAKSMSKFDVEGYATKDGLKGFVYLERGVRRPGDSIYVSLMLQDDNLQIPENYPVKIRLQNPMGVLVFEDVNRNSLNQVWTYRIPTSSDWPTGNYVASLMVGNQTFQRSIMVETVKPNRLRINLSTLDKLLSARKKSKLLLESQWLHGADAAGLQAVVEMNLTGGYTRFDGFEKYNFDDPLKSFYARESVVFEGSLDKHSKAEFVPEISVKSTAPGMLQATFVSKVFEGGGDFSIDRKMLYYSPFENYVGLRLPESQLFGGALLTDENQVFDVVLLNEEGKPQNGEIELSVYKIDHNWWWDSYNRNISSYINRPSTVAIKSEKISVRNGKGNFSLNVKKGDWGRYYVKLTHAGGHSTGRLVMFDWPYWSRTNRGKDENAAMLGFSTDKNKYDVGEDIKISIPSPKQGRALVTVENGSKVLAHHWVETVQGETQFSLKATELMTPNVYVHITLTQPHAATENDLPIRMYGVVPIEVEDKNTMLNPVIASKNEWKPESVEKIMVSNKEKRPMTYTLAVVDEGLLDLTSFRTPNPWRFFYSKEALGVRTWDVYDDVLGAYGKRIDQLLAVGGDATINSKANPSANRFKPMVRFIGPFYYDGKSPNNHTIDVPNYVGSVRIMVVARGDQKDYGSAEKAVPVKNNVMVLTTLPRVLGPGEEVVVPVNVFNMEDKSKTVNVSVKGNALLRLVGESSVVVKFDGKGDKIVNFRFSAAQDLGIGKINVLATDNVTRATDELEIDIRPSNPLVTEVEQFVLEPGQTLNHAVKLIGLRGTNELSLELSTLPGINLDARLQYLTSYPHGCLEQIISSGFPQIYAGRLLETDATTRKRMQDNVISVIERLPLYFNNSGGLSYWQGQSNVHPWASVYAGHFLAEAELNGYSVPWHVRRTWLDFERNNARNWIAGNAQNSAEVQAYRLFVLALMGQEDPTSMNRLRDDRNLSHQAKWLLSGAYVKTGRTDVAKSLVDSKAPVQFSQSSSATFGSRTRDEAMALTVLAMMNERVEGMKLTQRIIKELNSNRWMSTQTTAFSLMAVSKFLNAERTSNIMEFDLQEGNQQVVSRKSARQMIKIPMAVKNQDLNIKNTGKSPIYVSLTKKGIPMQGTEKTESNVLNMNVSFYNSHTMMPIDPTKIEQGTDFTMEVEIRNDGSRGALSELALNLLFPSGWEIHNSRMLGYSANSGIDYQDIRDDRVLSYFNLAASNSVKVKIRLNASYLGKFYFPGILAEAMYDGEIKAFSSGMYVEVVPKPKPAMGE